MSDDGRLTIHSYRVCFSLERRIHKIDRWRIPVPFGVPLRGIGYAAAVLVGMLILGRFPVVGPALTAVHPAIRLIALPCCAGYVLYLWEIDGRPAHIALVSAARLHLGPQRIVAFRSTPAIGTAVRIGDVTSAPDDSTVRLRRGIVRGPATVVLRYPFQAQSSKGTLLVSQEPGRAQWQGKQVTLRDGERLVAR